MLRSIDHFIGGSSFTSGERQSDVFDPNQGQVQAQVRLGTAAALQRAVDAARAAQPAWAATNPQRRARVKNKIKELVEAHMDELAELLSSEHGKVIADAKGDVQRGLEVIEYACGIPQALKGEYTEGAGTGIDVYSMRQPIGICAGITPFNFPAPRSVPPASAAWRCPSSSRSARKRPIAFAKSSSRPSKVFASESRPIRMR